MICTKPALLLAEICLYINEGRAVLRYKLESICRTDMMQECNQTAEGNIAADGQEMVSWRVRLDPIDLKLGIKQKISALSYYKVVL